VEIVLFFLLILIIVANLLILSLFFKLKPDNLAQIIQLMQRDSQKERESILGVFSREQQQLHARLDSTGRMLSEISRNLGEVSEIGRSMKDVQEFLLSPKLRGNLGEQLLNDLLSQILPNSSYALQYGFKNGQRVDAIVKINGGIIPIDSKFPMETYVQMVNAKGEDGKSSQEKVFERSIKNHIDSISEKYVLPSEGTIDYALMYLPSEPVYYEVVRRSELYTHAQSKHVLVTSPSTLYAYLRSVLISLEGQKIESRAKQVMASISKFRKDLDLAESDLKLLSKHINNAQSVAVSLTSDISKLGSALDETKRLG